MRGGLKRGNGLAVLIERAEEQSGPLVQAGVAVLRGGSGEPGEDDFFLAGV